MPPVVYITNGPLRFCSAPSLFRHLSFLPPFYSSFHFVSIDPRSYYPVNWCDAVIEPYASQAIIQVVAPFSVVASSFEICIDVLKRINQNIRDLNAINN